MTERNENDGLLTKQEAATQLRVAVRTVERLINTGRLPATRIGKSPAGRIRIYQKDVTALLVPVTPADSTSTDEAEPAGVSASAAA